MFTNDPLRNQPLFWFFFSLNVLKNKAFQRRVDFTEARSFKPLLQSDNSCCHVCQVEH